MPHHWPSLLSAFWALPLFVASYGIGARVLEVFREDEVALSVRVTLASGLGWLALSYLTLALGLTGLLHPAALWVLLALATAAGAGPTWVLLREARARLVAGAWREQERHVRWLVGLLGVIGAATFLRSCTFSLWTDTWVYHYALPRLWLRAHVFGNTHTTLFDLVPHGQHLLHALALGVGGDLAADKIGWLTAMGVVVGAYAACRACGWGARMGVYAAAMVATIHVVAAAGAGGLLDTAATLYCLGAAIGVLLWLRERRWGSLVVAGLLAAMATATRVNSLGFVGALVIALAVVELAGRRIGSAVLGSAALLGVLAAGNAFWFAWSTRETGNPIYPVLNSVFGSHRTPGWALDSWHAEALSRGFAFTPLTALTYPWHLTMDFPLLRGQWSSGIGPALLAFIPLLLWYRRRGIGTGFSLALAVPYLAMMYWLCPQMVRYIMPVFPWLAVLAANAAVSYREAWEESSTVRRWLVPALLLFPLLVGSATETMKLVRYRAWRPLLGIESDAQFLRRTQGGLFPAIEFANARLGPQDKILLLGHQSSQAAYLLNIPYSTTSMFRGWPEKPWSQALQELRVAGVTHALLSQPEVSPRMQEEQLVDTYLHRAKLETLYAGPGADPVTLVRIAYP